MRYERPAVERRVAVSGPVIRAVAPGSPTIPTPTWAPHDSEGTQ